MSKESEITIYFVTDSKSDHPKEEPSVMLEAFELCKQNNIFTKWLLNSKCKTLKFDKSNIIVMEKFEGDSYDYLQKKGSVRIVGPWCLLVCLLEGVPIPHLSWPIYNIAMKNVFVTCSGFKKEEKVMIKTKVHAMAGLYSDSLLDSTTHLITNSVQRDKYKAAIKNGIKIMEPKWIDVIWEDSQCANIKATSEKYDNYKVKVFYNLTITITGFTDQEKTCIINNIKENGGIYTGSLNLSKTDVLVCQDGTRSEKYKAAKRSGRVRCVNKDWIKDSISNGYAILEDNFTAVGTTSTPNKETDLPNFSMMSSIMQYTSRECNNTYDQTINLTSMLPVTNTELRKRKSEESDDITILNGIDVKKAKIAGTFLDGCNIYLIGFTAEEKDKVSKILDFSGATRYDDINDRLTHCIVGDSNCQEFKSILNRKLLNCPIVSMNWLSDSIEQKQPVPETEYLIKMIETTMINVHNSPLSQKGLSLLKRNTSTSRLFKTKLNFDDFDDNSENNLLNEYLNSNSKRTVTSSVASTSENDNNKKSNDTNLISIMSDHTEENDTTTSSNIFDGILFKIDGFEDNVVSEIKIKIEQMSGKVLGRIKRIKPNYIVLPTFIEDAHNISIETVNNMWIADCFDSDELINPNYYHKPIIVKRTAPLSGLVITITNYVECERLVLESLVEELGARNQKELSRKAVLEKKILPNTHLISPNTEGRKYMFAVKWKLPIVTKDWLLECGRLGMMVPLKSYIVNENAADTSENNSKSDEDYNQQQKQVNNTNESPQQPVEELLNPLESKEVKIDELQEERPKSSAKSVTPPGVGKFNDYSTPKGPFLQKRLQELKGVDLTTPENVPTPKPYGYVETPETPYGAFLDPNPSPNLRKAFARMLNKFPNYKTPPARRLSTPFSELKRLCWERILPSKLKPFNLDSDQENEPPQSNKTVECNVQLEEATTNEIQAAGPEPLDTQDIIFDMKLEQLENKLSTSSAHKKLPRKRISTVTTSTSTATYNIQNDDHMLKSQPMTVGWDFAYSEDIANRPLPPKSIVRKFMLSCIANDEQKKLLVEQIESLGGVVSSLSTYDSSATHLVCSQPARNEKIFSCMAAGKWILHTKYIEASIDKNEFVDEELYEFGNPKFVIKTSKLDATVEARYNAIHYWRKEISSRGFGAFHDVRGIVVATNRNGIIGVIKSGGGIVLDVTPPFYDNVFSATHCFIEPKAVTNFNEYVPLAKQGIYCINILYISEFLHLTKRNIKDSVLPMFKKYYNNS